MSTIRIAAAALTIAAALALTGCGATPATPAPTAPASAVADGPNETPAETEAPVVEAAPAPAPAPVAGDVITAEVAETLPEGVRAYPMADGTLVTVVDGQPLPAQVEAEIEAPLAAVVAHEPADKTGPNPAAAAAAAEARSAVARLGRTAVVVYPSFGVYGWRYQAFVSERQRLLDEPSSDRAVTMAAAEAYVAGQANPAAWVIIDVTAG
ncbi:hypothetical protein [Actinotalea sp. JY-7885]|uniref:hypothetical protein n=1 Tax=Actinotalea sp. JY-7885 TaxID=2758576 RepID=UPI00165E9D76|nr:hypothetical protein [Actinotalea sp. JY-7885]